MSSSSHLKLYLVHATCKLETLFEGARTSTGAGTGSGYLQHWFCLIFKGYYRCTSDLYYRCTSDLYHMKSSNIM